MAELALSTQRVVITPKTAGDRESAIWATDLVALALSMMSMFDIVVDDDEPGDTTKLWYDVSYPSSTAAGTLKVYYDGAWATATPELVANTIFYLAGSRLQSNTVAELGALTGQIAGAFRYCSDETGGAVPAFYDGTNWRRVTDRTIVS